MKHTPTKARAETKEMLARKMPMRDLSEFPSSGSSPTHTDLDRWKPLSSHAACNDEINRFSKNASFVNQNCTVNGNENPVLHRMSEILRPFKIDLATVFSPQISHCLALIVHPLLSLRRLVIANTYFSTSCARSMCVARFPSSTPSSRRMICSSSWI